jgi:uncharacterized protein YdaU (DUF1376 family)
MGKDPAFLFYPNDWLGGTMGMTFEEKGAYISLLMMQFNRGHMSGHMIGQEVGQLWDKIKDKFLQDDNGLWYNERLDIEKEKRQTFVQSRRNNINGKNQYSKKEDKNIGHMKGHTTHHMENENDNEDINEIINNYKVQFENFRQLYPGRKRGTDTEFENLIKKHKDYKQVVPILSDRLSEQIETRRKLKDRGAFVPEWKNLQTWINQRCWEEEVEIEKTPIFLAR